MSETPAEPDGMWSVARIEACVHDAGVLLAARELLRGEAFPHVRPGTGGRNWWAVCQGVTDVYRVAVRIAPYGLESECACPSQKRPCKHALALMLHLARHPELRAAGTPNAPPDFEGLLGAIFTSPTDDTPRLAFADYLDETGRPDRAALIRAQCGLPGDTTEDELFRRLGAELDLPDGFGVRVVRGFARLDVSAARFEEVGARAARVVNLFRNGWAEAVRFSEIHDPRQPELWSAESCALLAQAGLLDFTALRRTDVQLTQLATDLRPGDTKNRLARVLVHPADENLYAALLQGSVPAVAPAPGAREEAHEELPLHRPTPEHLGLLIRTRKLDRVRTLNLFGAAGDAELVALAGGPGLRLAHLNAYVEGVSAVGLGALAAAPWFPGLERLRLHGPTADAIAALGRARPPRLVELELTAGGIGDDALAALAGQFYPSLRTLKLAHNLVTDVGVAGLLAAERLPALCEIDLALNPVPPEVAAELVLAARDRPRLDVRFGHTHVSRVVSGGEFRLCVAHGSGAGLDRLAAHPALQRVTALALCDQPIRGDTAATLAAALSPEHLRELDLSGCSLDDPFPHIVRFCALPGLATLSLARMGLKYVTVARLALNPVVARLQVLDLSDNPLGPTGLDAVLNSPHLTKVERFVFRGTMGLSLRDRAHFQKRFGARAQFA